MLFILSFASSFILAQSLEIRGIVIDSTTNQPVIYANVGIKKLGIGTITNEQGKFTLKLPNSALNQIVNIQVIGFKAYSFKPSTGNNTIICKITPFPKELKEVIVLPKDTLLNMLRLAYRSIPKNYPENPHLYTGFYREVQKANDTLYLNFTEAVLDVYKQGYDKSSNFGQIRIVKSRKNNFPGTDTINNVRFYGGPHIAHSCDFVFKRSDFINPRHFKNYNYWLADRQKTESSEIYLIGFKRNDDSITGTIYLEKSSLAYIGLELHAKKDKKPLLHFYKHNNAVEKVGYFQYQDKWYLNFVILNTKGENINLNKKVTLHDVYVTTSLKTDSVKPIPYDQEFAYTDVISIIADDYTQTSWKDYNIIAEDSSLSTQDTYGEDESQKILSRTYFAGTNKKERFLSVLRHFSGNYGIEYLPLNFHGGLYDVSYRIEGLEPVSVKNLSPIPYSLGFYSKVAYTIDKHWGIICSSVATLSSHLSNNTWGLGIQYTTPVLRNSRKWFADFSLEYSHSSYYYDYGKVDKTKDEVRINTKTFDASKIHVSLGTKYSEILPSFTLQYKVGSISYLFITASGKYNLSLKDVVQFKEKSGFFLSRKTQTIPLEKNQVQLSINGVQTNNSGFNIGSYRMVMGLSLKF